MCIAPTSNPLTNALYTSTLRSILYRMPSYRRHRLLPSNSGTVAGPPQQDDCGHRQLGPFVYFVEWDIVFIDMHDWQDYSPTRNGIMNQEIIRAKAIIAELRLNNEKSHQLIHTQKNLRTVRWLILEQIHRTSRNTRQPQSSIPRLTTARITKELSNLTIEVKNMRNVKRR